LHDNPQYPACVARKLYSYSRGLKNSVVADFPDTYKAFQDSGFRLRALLKSIAVSDSFYAAGPAGNPSSDDSTKLKVDPSLVDRCPQLPELHTFHQGLGCMYVLEGSTLGSKFIAHRLAEHLRIDRSSGGAFFNAYGEATGARWAELDIS
jgi:hypothetical protein